MNNNRKNDMTIARLLTSDDYAACFQSLAEALNFEFNVYSGDGAILFSTKENSFCSFIKSTEQDDLTCPASCSQFIFESMESNETVIFKCNAELTCFAFALEQLGEKAFIVGKGGFALYSDLLKFLKIAKDRNLPGVPVSMPLDFPGEEYIETVSRYVYLSVNRLMNSYEEKYKLEEKILRMTSLFDSHIFGTLARNPGLIHRYILDTVEFVFGRTSSALMLLDEDSSSYRAAYSTGRYGQNIKDFQFDKEGHLIKELIETGVPVFTEDLDEIDTEGLLKEIEFSYFFPLFMNGVMEGIIWVLDRKFSREDMKIMNAFRDYIQVNLENQNLRVAIGKIKKADETLNSFMDFSKSIASVLDKEGLLRACHPIYVRMYRCIP